MCKSASRYATRNKTNLNTYKMYIYTTVGRQSTCLYSPLEFCRRLVINLDNFSTSYSFKNVFVS